MKKRKDGRYQSQLTLNGKTKYFYGKSPAEVNRKINAYSGDVIRGRLFKDVAHDWDAAHEKDVTYHAHRTYNVSYKEAVKEFGETPINQITPGDIDAFIRAVASKGYALRTVKVYISLFNMIFAFAVINGDVETNPAQYIKPPRGLKTSKREIPDKKVIKAIKKHVDTDYGLFPFFLLYTGCRRGEALAIRYDDINTKNNSITIDKSVYYSGNQGTIKSTKTESGKRIIPLLDDLKEKLPTGQGYMFGTETSPPTQSMVKRRWESWQKTAGVKVTPHQLRHLFATILYEAKIDDKMTQEILGHASISTTRDIYTHIRAPQIEKVRKKLNKIVIK